MTDLTERPKEELSRQQAAQHLVNLAQALQAGGSLDVDANGHSVRVPIADQVVVQRKNKSTGDGVVIELELSWSTVFPSQNEFSAATAF
jgi:amphi-Trp domain-containing protein